MDEITVLELLDISSEEIVERFADLIEAKADQLEIAIEEDTFIEDEEFGFDDGLDDQF